LPLFAVRGSLFAFLIALRAGAARREPIEDSAGRLSLSLFRRQRDLSPAIAFQDGQNHFY
jgi:hypothetical protein